MKTFTLDSNGIKEFRDFLLQYKGRTQEYFGQLGLMLHQRTMLTFAGQGARAGHPAWRPFSPNTLNTPSGTPRIRLGTDMKPKRSRQDLIAYRAGLMRAGKWRWGQTGIMPGYTGVRRYSGESKLLQASGGFKRSFKIQEISNNRMKYGTRFQAGKATAEDIIKDREVIFLMPVDYIAIRKQFMVFMANMLGAA